MTLIRTLGLVKHLLEMLCYLSMQSWMKAMSRSVLYHKWQGHRDPSVH